MSIRKKLGLLGATFFTAAAGMVVPAMAQDAQQPAQAGAQAEPQEEEVVVTGSRIRRDEFTSSAPIQVITGETATLEGLIDAGEVLQSSSVAAGSFQLNGQFGGFVVEGGTGINSVSLRGLGAQRSLVLLNGRRPGPAGVRGQVGAFDLNVIPSSVVQRYEILKDGASSVYGSDAVAGVVNVITVDRVDDPIINFEINQPFEDGGESYSIDGAYGLNFSRGNVVIAGQYQIREDLSVGDRDYLSCPQDLIYSPTTGARIDREDRSILRNTNLAGCNNIYFNTVIDAVYGTRYIPDPAGGPGNGIIPGYRPRANQNYPQGDPNTAYYEDVLNDRRFASTDAIERQERASLFVTSNFSLDALGGVDWRNELLVSHRKSNAEGWRQFFPLIGGASAAALLDPYYGYDNDPGYDPAVGPSARIMLSQPITLWPSNAEAEVNYWAYSTQLDGDFSNNWSWSLVGTYSRSEGDYRSNQILGALTGDVDYSEDAPNYDPFSASFLSGNYGSLYDTLTYNSHGETIYEQTVFTGYVSGDLLQLPAGPLGVAFGAEYRNYSINDTPDALSTAGALWGTSSAGPTRGEDTVREIFAELEVPILAGRPFFEDLSLDLSGRAFDYDSYGSDSVWKAGLNWQINSMFRIRATKGTSYRAPALYELFLGNQTAFLSQLSIDPCIDWGNSTNPNIQANCAADGIPSNYTGLGSSATIVSTGGAGLLDAETSNAYTVGFIFTPTFADLSVAVDYFEIQVNDQVAQLGAAAILGGCYGANNYPNQFCTLFDRNPGSTPGAAYNITEVRDSYVNVNQQITSGIDLTVRYDHEFDFGDLTLEAQGTWTFEDIVYLFEPSLQSGFDTSDFNGTVGDPDFVANARISFERGDWTYSWFTDFISRVSQQDFAAQNVTYQGVPGRRIIAADPVFYHDASVRWRGDTFSVLAGVSNVFDEEPPLMSTGVVTRRGNVPLSGTQYDLRGRTAFVRFTKTF